MSLLRNKKLQFFAAITSVIVFTIIVVLFKNSKKTEISETRPAEKGVAGFTFFDLGENSEFSSNIRDKLRDRLGSDAIEYWSTLDLATNYKGFLQNYFPELYALNKRLNSPVGERVEHNTIKLTYRYARRKNLPFDYVELIFSNYTKKPLLFYIKSKKEGLGVIDTLKKKYGEAKTVDWEKEEGRSLYWGKNRSVLILSISDDRYGKPVYYTMIYYVPNLEELLSIEQQEIKHKEEKIKKNG